MPWICSGRASGVVDALDGIERRERVLEDHLDVRAVREQRLAPPLVADVLAVEDDLAVGRRVEPREQARHGALAAAALAHERRHVSGPQRERDVRDGVEHLAAQPHSAHREALAEALDLERAHGPSTQWQATWCPGSISRRSGPHPGLQAVQVAVDPGALRAARVEAAARRRVAEIGRRAGDARERQDRPRERRERAHQPVRVRMQRVPEEDVRGRGLDDLARVHDRDAIAELDEQREVVRDEQHREAEAPLELLELLQDLALHDHVERRRRLVHHDQLGLERQRHRDHHALAHAARQLVRIRAHARRARCRRARAGRRRGRAPRSCARGDRGPCTCRRTGRRRA